MQPWQFFRTISTLFNRNSDLCRAAFNDPLSINFHCIIEIQEIVHVNIDTDNIIWFSI